MPKCQKIHRKKRQVCIGDLNEEIVLQSRAITPPTTDDVDFTETFTGTATVWAAINTVSGETIFDGTGTERDVTHHIYIRYLAGITAETWISFSSERFDILDVENLDKRNEFMVLRCTNRGTDANVANEL